MWGCIGHSVLSFYNPFAWLKLDLVVVGFFQSNGMASKTARCAKKSSQGMAAFGNGWLPYSSPHEIKLGKNWEFVHEACFFKFVYWIKQTFFSAHLPLPIKKVVKFYFMVSNLRWFYSLSPPASHRHGRKGKRTGCFPLPSHSHPRCGFPLIRGFWGGGKKCPLNFEFIFFGFFLQFLPPPLQFPEEGERGWAHTMRRRLAPAPLHRPRKPRRSFRPRRIGRWAPNPFGKGEWFDISELKCWTVL